MKTEEEITNRINWLKRCFSSSNKKEMYAFGIQVLEWVLED